MRLRSTIRYSIGSWLSLPREIRLAILELIVKWKFPGWVSLASVCEEWQFTIAGANLRKLRLQQDSCLLQFGNAIVLQREFVKHIWLDLKLPSYTCRSCSFDSFWNIPGSRVVRKTIKRLFTILSSWGPRGAGGLTLELNAYCASDSLHWFRGFYFNNDEQEDDNDVASPAAPRHDERHGWLFGRRFKRPPKGSILRLFEHIMPYITQNELPQVPAVTRLVVRRQMRRRLDPCWLGQVLDKLPSLQDFVFEPWRGWERSMSQVGDDSTYALLWSAS